MDINTVHNMDAIEFMKSLDDKIADMILVDLPYQITNNKWDIMIPFEPMWKELLRISKDKAAMVFTAVQPFTSMLVSSNYKMYRHMWIWNKNNSSGFFLAKYRPFQITEDILVFSKKSPHYYPIMTIGQMRNKGGYGKSDNYSIDPRNAKNKNNLYYPKNILNYSGSVQRGKLHPTQKPVDLFEYLIKTYTLENQLVIDFTAGSGTTAIAAMRCNRNYIVNDISEKYVAIINTRIEEERQGKHDE